GDAIPRPPLPRCCMVTRAELRPADPAAAKVWDIAARVPDPEVPVLTIEDLGVLREARVSENGVHVVLTPTYSGCPAIDKRSADVTPALRAAGYENSDVSYALGPAWTTDWMSEEGKRKLKEFGIVPLVGRSIDPVFLTLGVRCPRCDSI